MVEVTRNQHQLNQELNNEKIPSIFSEQPKNLKSGFIIFFFKFLPGLPHSSGAATSNRRSRRVLHCMPSYSGATSISERRHAMVNIVVHPLWFCRIGIQSSWLR